MLKELLEEVQKTCQKMADEVQAERAVLAFDRQTLSMKLRDVEERERTVVNREKALESTRKDLALARTQYKAALEREAALDAKLRETRRLLGVSNERLAKIDASFPQLMK